MGSAEQLHGLALMSRDAAGAKTRSWCQQLSLSILPGAGDLVHAADHLPLGIAQIGIPAVEDQQGTVARCGICGFVLDRVVEYERFAFDPVSSFAADPERAALGHDQRKMDDRADIGHPGM